MQPIQNNDRIWLIDALRGFAILGIFIANLGAGFAFYRLTDTHMGPFFHPWDETLFFWEHVFIEGKFYSIFSLLFGWGVALQIQRTTVKGLPAMRFMRRRLAFMFLLGSCHLLLLWTGDIVAFYGLVGFLLLVVRNWSSRKLFITAVACILSPIIIYYLKMEFVWLNEPAFLLFDIGDKIEAAWVPAKDGQNFIGLIGHGNYWQQVKWHLSGFFYRFGDLFFQSRIFKVFGMFVLGYLLGQNKRFENILANRKLLWIIVAIGLLTGLPSNYILAKFMKNSADYENLTINGWYRTSVYALGVAPLACFYVASIFLISATAFGKKMLQILAPVGKMAFSNYILHSIIGNVVFFGTGWGLVKQVGPVYFTVFAFIVFGVQVFISKLWLRYFEFGPIEWLWRSLTYGKIQPIRRQLK